MTKFFLFCELNTHKISPRFLLKVKKVCGDGLYMHCAILHWNDHTVLSHCPISAEDRAPASHLDEIILLQL